jgi:hypothetical protein
MMKKKNKKSSIDLLKDKIEEIGSGHHWNYHSGVDYDYESYYACANGSNCCDHDYCRCRTIQNARVKNIDPILFASVYTDKIEDEFLRYCIDRLVCSSGLLCASSWEVSVHGGYYGEEVDGATPDPSLEKSFKDSLIALTKSKNNYERLKLTLEAEYGHLIPALNKNNYKVSIENVSPDLIKLGNDDYMRKIDKKNLIFYKEYNLPRAVCFHEGKHYRVIDGYHRTTAALQNKLETIKIISLEKTNDDLL